MKRLFNLVRFFGTLVLFSLAATHSAQGSMLNLSNPASTSQSGMPGWPVPSKPIPHHEPGMPARLGNEATYPIDRLNAEGQSETVNLTGLDALLANGTLTDPLQGNYRLAGLDKIMFSHYTYSPNNFSVRTFEWLTTTLGVIPGSTENYGNARFNTLAAGDLNGDLVDEQITAWVNSSKDILLNIRELPGAFGQATSAPAVVAHPDGSLDVMVRGYDDALWHIHFDGTRWGNWNGTTDQAEPGNSPGGTLLSNPVATSRAAGEVDVFALGLDNQVYQTQWISPTWSGTWTMVDCGDDFPVTQPTLPLPSNPALGLAAPGSNQLDLFRRGSDNTLRWCHSADGTTWGSWQNLGGMLASEPGAVALGNGRMQAYALGADGSLWYLTYDGGWGSWQTLNVPDGLAEGAVPALVSPGPGQVAAYLHGADDQVWSIQYNGSTWGSWSSIPVTNAGKSAAGKQGTGVKMDGRDDDIQVVIDVSETSYAASFWFRTTCQDCGMFSVVGDVNNPGGYHDRHVYLKAGAVCARVWSDETICTSGTDFADGNWHHVVHTYGSAIGGQKLYLDGLEHASGTKSSSNATAQTGVLIGVSVDAASDYFAGQIDEVAVFSRTLTLTDVAQIYSSNWDSLAGLQMGFHLEESPIVDGTSLADSSGHGNNGTFSSGEASDFKSDPSLGVAISSGGTYLFAKMSDGNLQYRWNTSNWTNLPGVDISVTIDTLNSIGSLPSEGDLAIENSVFDMTTGYFSGDGRQQIVLAYDGESGLVLRIYDVRNGFWPVPVAGLTTAISSAGWPRVAAGDVNGDGLDEIGLVYVPDSVQGILLKVFQLEKDLDGQWTGNLTQLSQNQIQIDDGGDINNGWPFAGTLRIAAGDFSPDAGSPNDEFVVASDWRHNDTFIWTNRKLRTYVHFYDYQAASRFTEKVYNEIDANTILSPDWDELYANGIGLAVGDVDGVLDAQSHAYYDEIVVTMPYDLYQEIYPRVRRYLRVYQYNPGTTNFDQKAQRDLNPEGSFPNTDYSLNSFLDTLVVGDLDQDLVDEIVLAYEKDIYNTSHRYYLDVYEYSSLSSGPVIRLPLSYASTPRAFNLALGDFSGQSIRVGPPSYREQDRVDSVLARLNMPPKHWDMIKNPDGTYSTIKILTDRCAISPTDPLCSRTLHGTIEGNTSSTSIETQRDWAIAVGTEWRFSNVKLVEGSLEKSYGQNFSSTTEAITTTQFTQVTTAVYDDAIVTYNNLYRIWEYPVYNDNTTEPGRYITVIFPDVSQGTTPSSTAGAICQEDWYGPGHQPYNIWSYDPIGVVQYPDYDPNDPTSLILEGTYYGTQNEFKVYFENLTNVRTSNSQFHGIDSKFGLGYEVSGQFSGLGKAKNFTLKIENRFKVYANGKYYWKDIVTDKTQTSNATYMSAYLASPPSADVFQTRAIAYWSTAGALVIDFQSEPGNTATWARYNKPDPAFILPWYGYPDPNNLPFPDPNNHGAPPCGPDKKLFSHDIAIEPAFASVGETVTISATVRNFSNVPVSQAVTVRFYLGEPDMTNVIGSCVIQPFEREDGAQQCAIDWSVTGAGQQKIFAVIDPDGHLTEMHDENHIVNNNTGYALIQIGAGSFFDMGVSESYAAIGYSQDMALAFNLLAPAANLNATTRFDLHDLAVENLPAGNLVAGNLSLIGNPFELVAIQGTRQRGWGDPIENFVLRPEAGDPPAAIQIDYAGANLSWAQENQLMLYRYTGLGWQPANLDCGVDGLDAPLYPVLRFPQKDQLVVPICQNGIFALNDRQPGTLIETFLALILR